MNRRHLFSLLLTPLTLALPRIASSESEVSARGTLYGADHVTGIPGTPLKFDDPESRTFSTIDTSVKQLDGEPLYIYHWKWRRGEGIVMTGKTTNF